MRPNGWENPYLAYPNPQPYDKAQIFEAGADAMLEALKNKGSIMSPEQMKLLVPDRKYPFGWLVFIPDEK